MKRVPFFVMAAIAIATTSCTKDVAFDPSASSLEASNAKTSASVNNAAADPVSKVFLSATKSNYGALIDASSSSDSYMFETSIASTLGLSCLRDVTPVPSTKKVKTLTSPYNILLNFTSSGAKPLKFRTDTAAYKVDLQNTIASLLAYPQLAIIENEESNKGYYKGTAGEYITQLKAAINVMHSYGIPVTNGAITSTGLQYLVYQDFLNRGMTAEANDYKAHLRLAIRSSNTLDRANFVGELIANYATMDLDYVSFHWRNQMPSDSSYLTSTIEYLKRATGKKVITTEIGQYDKDPLTLTSTVRACKNSGCQYIIWYSGAEDCRSYPLQNADMSLTSTGFAYQNFIKTN